VPLGIDPRLSQGLDGVIVLDLALFPKCFKEYFIGEMRDEKGFVKIRYDKDLDDGAKSIYSFAI